MGPRICWDLLGRSVILRLLVLCLLKIPSEPKHEQANCFYLCVANCDSGKDQQLATQTVIRARLPVSPLLPKKHFHDSNNEVTHYRVDPSNGAS